MNPAGKGKLPRRRNQRAATPAPPPDIRVPEPARPVIPGTNKRIGGLALATGQGPREASAA